MDERPGGRPCAGRPGARDAGPPGFMASLLRLCLLRLSRPAVPCPAALRLPAACRLVARRLTGSPLWLMAPDGICSNGWQ